MAKESIVVDVVEVVEAGFEDTADAQDVVKLVRRLDVDFAVAAVGESRNRSRRRDAARIAVVNEADIEAEVVVVYDYDVVE